MATLREHTVRSTGPAGTGEEGRGGEPEDQETRRAKGQGDQGQGPDRGHQFFQPMRSDRYIEEAIQRRRVSDAACRVVAVYLRKIGGPELGSR